MKNKIIAMIPARIGSKRLKFKNLALINKKPLISYAIEAAKKSKKFDKIVLNSDHKIFKDIAKRYKVDFYLRNKYLGKSNIKSDDVVYDFMKSYEYEIFCWINPIAPLQEGKDIIKTINYFNKNKLDSLITTESKKVHGIIKSKPINYNINKKFDQTQELDSIKLFNYTIMMWKKKVFVKEYVKKNYAFFCGKFDTYDLGKDASIIVKNSEDLRMINYIINNKNKPNFNKPRYDVLLNKTFYKKKNT